MKKALVTLIVTALAVSIPSAFANRGGQMKPAAAADDQADSAPAEMFRKGKGKGGPGRGGKGTKGGTSA